MSMSWRHQIIRNVSAAVSVWKHAPKMPSIIGLWENNHLYYWTERKNFNMKTKKYLITMLTLCAALSLTACNGTAPTAKEPVQNRFDSILSVHNSRHGLSLFCRGLTLFSRCCTAFDGSNNYWLRNVKHEKYRRDTLILKGERRFNI